jgi:hypothetical protein
MRPRTDTTGTRGARARRRAVTALVGLAASGCAGSSGMDDAAPAEVTVVSDDSRATVPPLCVEDIPQDLTTCENAPENLGELELDETRKVTVQVPAVIASSGYRVRVNGQAPPGLTDVVEDQAQPLQIPASAVAAPGETVLTVEALHSTSHPKAAWQFLLSDPAGAPN